MASDWLKWCKGLPKKPQVIEMARLLGRSRHEIASLLMEVWDWAEENATVQPSAECPGFVRIVSASGTLVDDAVGVAGLADAMVAVGWLAIRDGRLEFPKFGRHNGSHAKRRALDADRQRAARVRKTSATDADESTTDSGSPHREYTPSKKRSTPFKKPSLEEVKSYCLERGNKVNPQRFLDFYESKGWKVGKNPMKDWRAAVRTWEQRAESEATVQHDPRGNLAAAEAYLAMGGDR